MMTNHEIAAIFRELAALLEQKKENWFKIRSYRKAADEIENSVVALSLLAAENRLREVPGVGDAIEKKIKEILATGKLSLVEKLKQEIAESRDAKTASA